VFSWTRPFETPARWLGLEPDEGRRLALMGALVAVLLCGYTIAKVLRDSLFLAHFGALALPYAYVAVALASAGFVWIESRIARRFSRVGASQFNQYLAILCSVAAALVYPHNRYWTTAVFYVWTGSQAMMLLPHFWVLALDIWDSRRARRVFPILAGCGLIGGLAGGAFAGWTTPLVQRVGLMWTLPLLLLGAHVLTRAVERYRARRDRPEDVPLRVSPWKIIRRSPYILIFVVALALSVIVGTLVDFQFKYLIQHRYPDPHALTQFLGRFYFGLNALSLLFQFGAVGWLVQRFGLGVSAGLQPAAVLALASWAAVTPGVWVVIAMRWIQGVLSQTIGKSSNEIYYSAIRTSLRRRIKPAIDTLVERWSDAAVGVLLVVALHAFHLPVATIAIMTAVLTAGWIGVSFALDRQYGRAFRQVLSSRWIEPEDAPDAMRVPAARRALIEALHAEDERSIVLALQLSGQVKDARIAVAVRECLTHESPAVRAAAVDAMESMGLTDHENRIAGLLAEPHEAVRRAAVHYLLVRGPRALEFAHEVFRGEDETLHRYAVDVLLEHPCAARAALTLEWVDARLASTRSEDLLLAARGLGVLSGQAPVRRLRALLSHSDLEVRRAALQSAIRRPSREILDVLVPLLLVPGLHHEARLAIAAVGNPAVAPLVALLDGGQGARAQSLAANTLAQIGSRRAVQMLLRLARSSELRKRHLGLRGLARARVRKGEPVLPRDLVHRLFLRELRDYRDCLDPAVALESHAAAEVQLLADSYRESAERALERAMQALACWYEPEPLIGVLDRLRSRDRLVASPALEFLEHVLPRSIFGPVRRVFEEPAIADADKETTADPLAEWIEAAWNSEDGWLRACAVRASRFFPSFDPRRFTATSEEDPRVRAEIVTLGLPGSRSADAASQGASC
jgi:AAA family ATP:ADP antiporter